MEAAQQKSNYRKDQVLEPFYTGGAACITRDGKLLACVCGEEVKVSPQCCTGLRLHEFSEVHT